MSSYSCSNIDLCIFVVVSDPAGCLERNCSTRGLLSAENLFKFDSCSSKKLLHGCVGGCVGGIGITFSRRHIYTRTTERFSKARSMQNILSGWRPHTKFRNNLTMAEPPRNHHCVH